MSCERARTRMGRGRTDDPAVAAHLKECPDCRDALEKVQGADAILNDLFPDAGAPDREAEDQAVVAALSAPPRRQPVFQLAAAAVLLLVLGGAVGYALRGGGGAAAFSVAPERARHELAVFDALNESLDGNLDWLATLDGEVLLGMSASGDEGPRRVVFLEFRSADGATIARARLVVPEGRDVVVSTPDSPGLSVRAERTVAGRARVRCVVEFPDGAKLAPAPAEVAEGETALLGQVVTDGRPVSLYVAAF